MFIYKNVKDNREIIFCWLFVIMSLPTVWAGTSEDSTLSIGFVVTLIRVSNYVLLLVNLLVMVVRKYYEFTIDNLILISAVCTYWFFYYFNHYIIPSPAFLSLSFLLMFIVVKDNIKINIYVITKAIIFLTCFAGIMLYSFTVMQINIGQAIIPYYMDDGSGERIYISFCGLSLFSQGMMLRLCGYLNEPGYFGTIIALILTVEKCKITKMNLILFVAGVLTWSMAFFIIMGLNITYYYRKNFLRLIAIVILLFTFFTNSNIATDDGSVGVLISRFSFDEQNGLAGDNRSSPELDNVFYDTICSEKVFFGHGTGFAKTISTSKANLSYKTLIIEQGIVVFILAYIGIVYAALLKGKGVGRWLVLMFFISIYQRPNIFNILYFIVLYGGLDYMKYKSIKK